MNWAAVVLALKGVVHFPVLLPQYVPPVYVTGQHVYRIVETGRADFYSIDLAYDPSCNGAHVCSFAHVQGSKRPLPLGYVASTCHAYCSDAILTWKQGGAYYRITLNTGSLQQLRAMQRSMRAVR